MGQAAPEGTKVFLHFRKKSRAKDRIFGLTSGGFPSTSTLLTTQANATNAPPLADPFLPMDLRLKDHACRPDKSC